MNKRGRPPKGQDDGRERLLAAARELFEEHGYERASLRMIAERAQCDTALVRYHFGSKRDLFAAAMTMALGPASLLDAASEGPVEQLAERLAEQVIRAWDQPDVRTSLVTMLQTGIQHPTVLRAFREYLTTEIYDRLVAEFGGRDASARATATMTIVIGIIFGRYVIGVDPVRSIPPDELHARLRPSLRAITSPGRRP